MDSKLDELTHKLIDAWFSLQSFVTIAKEMDKDTTASACECAINALSQLNTELVETTKETYGDRRIKDSQRTD